MNRMEELQSLYDSYRAEVQALLARSKGGEGLFGFGKGPKDDPCHEKFIISMQKWMENTAKEHPDSQTAREMLEYVLHQQSGNEGTLLYWSFIGIHGVSAPLVSCLSQEDAAAILRTYEREFPHKRRLPAQDALADQLMAAAGESPKKKRLFFR